MNHQSVSSSMAAGMAVNASARTHLLLGGDDEDVEEFLRTLKIRRLAQAEFVATYLQQQQHQQSQADAPYGARAYVNGRARNRERQRLDWPKHCSLMTSAEFARYYRMPLSAFEQLCEILRPRLKVDIEMACRGSSGPVTPELQLSMTLRFLAGGSYLDIMLIHGVHRSTFFKSVWRTIDAINDAFTLNFPLHDEAMLIKIAQGFQSRRNNPLWGCVGAVDGIIIEILRPAADCPNSQSFYNRKGFFGYPMQAMCDDKYRFTFSSVKCTGSTHDSLALGVSLLGMAIDRGELPAPFWIAGDAAYKASSSLLTPWSGKDLPVEKDSFNFWVSSNRITIEQTFGIFVARWGILWRPLEVHYSDVPRLLFALMKLHNFCVDSNVALVSRHEDDNMEGDTLRLRFQSAGHDQDELRRRRRDLEHCDLRETFTAMLKESGIVRPQY